MFKKSMVCIVALLAMQVHAADSGQPSKEAVCKTATKKYETCMAKHDVAGEMLCAWRLVDEVWKCEAVWREHKACNDAAEVYQGCLLSYPPSSAEEAMKNCTPKLQAMIAACKKTSL